MSDYDTTVDSCTCKGFRFSSPRRACKHIMRARIDAGDDRDRDTIAAKPTRTHPAYAAFVAVHGSGEWTMAIRHRYDHLKAAYDGRRDGKNIGGGHGLLAKYGL